MLWLNQSHLTQPKSQALPTTASLNLAIHAIHWPLALTRLLWLLPFTPHKTLSQAQMAQLMGLDADQAVVRQALLWLSLLHSSQES
jgi:hypothetical protein